MRIRFSAGQTIAALFTFVLLVQVSVSGRAQFAPQPAGAMSIPSAQLMQPEELNKLLQAKAQNKPLILQVGSRVMFEQAHIVGAEYAGPGSHDDGVQALRNRVASLPRASFILIYCGCCPWNRCPNVGPAYKLLTGMGFTNLKVLYIADNFGANWANMGYPVVQSR